MEIDYINLSEYNVEFKQLISGPAPVGRILNYIILTGRGILKHKNGNRDLNLNDNIASAWCSEFMVGLGLIHYTEEKDINVYQLYLTENGEKIYELIKDYYPHKFNESSNPIECYKELMSFSPSAYNLLFKIFRVSPVCINLCRYMYNAGTNRFQKTTFYDEYTRCFQNYYNAEGTMEALTRSAGFNRLPSTIQMCQFFNCCEKTKDEFIFNYDSLIQKIDEYINFTPVDENKYDELKNENTKNEKIVDDLVKKYGIDGTVAREIITRNSSIQEIFRNNLIAKYGCKCAICNKKINALMVASHIVPASESNVYEKADYENGLLLCALHDKLFDRYLISFCFNDGKLLYASVLKNDLEEYQLSEDLTLEERFMTEKRKDYLLKHNMEFYERNK